MVQAGGQQPSPPAQVVMVVGMQAELQVEGLPTYVYTSHAPVKGHSVEQSPSQVSPLSTVPFPQVVEQSLSMPAHPAGQHPSPSRHSVSVWRAQATLQVAALPRTMSVVQAFPSSQLEGQFMSHDSPAPTMPSPQESEQSGSSVQPAGQQPSPGWHPVTGA
jgi:hypothetical protein